MISMNKIMNKILSQYISDKEKLNALTTKILLYQKKLDLAVSKEILKEISPYIWAYPKLSFRNLNEDIASDFYLYIHERFDNLLLKYQISLGKFSTYLAIRLQTYFFNFIAQRKQQLKDLEDLPLLEEQVTFNHEESKEVSIKTEVFLNQLELLRLKDSQKYLIIKLYYFDWFDENDFILFTKIFSTTYAEVLTKMDQMRNYLYKKKQKQLEYENQLGKIYTQNVSHQQYLKKEQVEKEANNEWKKKQKIIIEKYLATTIFPSATIIKEITGLEKRVIENTINSYKKVIKKKLKDTLKSSMRK